MKAVIIHGISYIMSVIADNEGWILAFNSVHTTDKHWYRYKSLGEAEEAFNNNLKWYSAKAV